MSDYNRNILEHRLPSPCKDCEKRHIACHSGCDEYKQWHKEYKALCQEIKRNRELFDEIERRIK